MNSNELRIGNFVQRKKQVLKVLNVQYDKTLLKGYPAGNRYFKLNDIDPIPITEELLLKAGFLKFSSNEYWFRKNDLCISLTGNIEFMSWDRNMFQLNQKSEYVHKLQNLFFSLYSEELSFF